MRKRGLCCGPVSVRLSVTFVYSIQTAEDIVKLLCRPGSLIILAFWPPAAIPNSKGNPFNGGAKYKGWVKFCDFRLKSPSISETVRDRPSCYGTLIGSHMRFIELWRFQWPWWTPNLVFKITVFFKSNISYGQIYYRTPIGKRIYHVWLSWLTSKRVARFVSDSRVFRFTLRDNAYIPVL